MSVVTHQFLILIGFLCILSLAMAGNDAGTTRCEKKHKLSKEMANTYRSWKLPQKLKTKEEKCYLHCVLSELGWMKDHEILVRLFFF